MAPCVPRLCHSTVEPKYACLGFRSLLTSDETIVMGCFRLLYLRLSYNDVRRYMAPEVALGKPYNGAADVYGECHGRCCSQPSSTSRELKAPNLCIVGRDRLYRDEAFVGRPAIKLHREREEYGIARSLCRLEVSGSK